MLALILGLLGQQQLVGQEQLLVQEVRRQVQEARRQVLLMLEAVLK